MTQWPFLERGIVYLDTAASAQKPRVVIDAISEYYSSHHANVHRGLHALADEATDRYEAARKTVAQFLNAASEKEIIFTSGTTDSLNLVAHSYPLTAEDTVVLTELEHHSNLVPWQQAAQRAGARLRFIPVKDNGLLDMDTAKQIISEGCSVLAVTHLSNVTGEAIDIKRLASMVHPQGGVIVVDGAQGAAHLSVDVQASDIDFYALSGHKVYGPTGIGVLYGKQALLENLSPFRFGGEMIDEVRKDSSSWTSVPQKFEAGTPPIAQAAGLDAALQFLMEHRKGADERGVHDYCVSQLSQLGFLTLIADPEGVGSVSFVVENVHPHDVAQYLSDEHGVAIRAGHHCTQVLHDRLGVPASCRASFGIYNTKDDVDKLVSALKQCKEVFDV